MGLEHHHPTMRMLWGHGIQKNRDRVYLQVPGRYTVDKKKNWFGGVLFSPFFVYSCEVPWPILFCKRRTNYQPLPLNFYVVDSK